MTITKKRLVITISPHVLEKIDKERGLIPRSTYINHILKQNLAEYIKGMTNNE